jgi:hypothetical protein
VTVCLEQLDELIGSTQVGRSVQISFYKSTLTITIFHEVPNSEIKEHACLHPSHFVPGIPRRPPFATPADVCLPHPSPSAAPSTRELLVLLISLGISKSQQSGPNRWQLLAASTTMYLPPATSTQHHPASSYGRERRHLPAAGSCPAASLPTTGSGRQHRGAEKL